MTEANNLKIEQIETENDKAEYFIKEGVCPGCGSRGIKVRKLDS